MGALVDCDFDIVVLRQTERQAADSGAAAELFSDMSMGWERYISYMIATRSRGWPIVYNYIFVL